MTRKIKPVIVLRIVLISLAIAWLTPLIVTFLPWKLTERVLVDYGFSQPFEPILRYWFVMASLLSGIVGSMFVYLLFNTEEKIKISLTMGFVHIFIGLVLFIRGMLWSMSFLVLVWDMVFCLLVGLSLVFLSLMIKKEKNA